MESIINNLGFIGYADSRIGGREENQDDYGFANTPLGLLVVVCDGMGGGPAGKTASSLARETIVNYVKACKQTDSPEDVLNDAIKSANSVLLGAISTNPALRGMGTTCVAVLLTYKTAHIIHVGDSRCYVLREGKAIFRTSDHSYVAEMVRKGELTEEQARCSNHSNVITRAIGIKPTIQPETDKLNVKAGDRFALMTDGIWGCLPENHLIRSLSQNDEIPIVVTELADRIDAMGHNEGGGHDNMTLAVIEIPCTQSNKPSQRAADKSSKHDNEDTTHQQGQPNWKKGYLLRSIIIGLLALSLGTNIFLYHYNATNSMAENKELDKLKKQIDSLKRVNRDLYMMIKAKKETIKNDSHTLSNEGNTGDKNESLEKAIIKLMQLDTLGDKQTGRLEQKSRNKLKERRKVLRDSIALEIKYAAACCQDSQGKSKILKIQDVIKTSNKLVNGIDSYGRTTRETKDSIKHYIKIINDIK